MPSEPLDPTIVIILQAIQQRLDGFDAKFDAVNTRLDERFRELEPRLDSIDVTLTKQAGSLDEHIRRTELLEVAVATAKKESVAQEKSRLLQKWTIRVALALALVALLGTGAAPMVKVLLGILLG